MQNIDRIQRALASCGLLWDELLSRAQGIILFGSQAAGCSSAQSDVDLLCIGSGPRKASRELHLLWIAPELLGDPAWLTSEFGGHVAKYGVWLKGSGTLEVPGPASANAINRKLSLIADRAEVLNEEWHELSRGFRIEQLQRLRRDVQRLYVLAQGGAVPPTPVLDDEWSQQREKRRFLKHTLASDQQLAHVVIELISHRSPKRVTPPQ